MKFNPPVKGINPPPIIGELTKPEPSDPPNFQPQPSTSSAVPLSTKQAKLNQKQTKSKENKPPTPNTGKNVRKKLPVKPPSPFLMFYNSERPKVKSELKNSSSEAIESELKRRWISIDEMQKGELEDKYRSDFELYELKVKLYDTKRAHIEKMIEVKSPTMEYNTSKQNMQSNASKSKFKILKL